MPRQKKSADEVSESRRAAAQARWARLKTPAKRRAATAAAVRALAAKRGG